MQAYEGTHLVPIAVPDICSKNWELNSKKWFFNTRSSSFVIPSVCIILCGNLSHGFRRTSRSSAWGMLRYSPTTSIVTGDIWKNSLFESFEKLPKKHLQKSCFLSNWSFPIWQPKLDWKITLPQMFSVAALRFVKFSRRTSAVESLFSKVTGEISGIYNSIQNYFKK